MILHVSATRIVKPGLCNKIRDEALTHHKSGSLAPKA